MSGSFDKLMLQIGLVDQVSRPLATIDRGIATTTANWQKMAGGSAAIMAAGVALRGVLDPIVQMDRALGEVASLGVAQNGLDTLSMTALNFSMDYGKSASEFVRASYDIQSAIAGLNDNELASFTESSALLAAATKADAGTITSYMGTLYGIFKTQATAMGKADWVAAMTGKSALAVQMFKTDGQNMADGFKALGAAATSAGADVNEQFAVLGTLQATMSGSEAGTRYKAFIGNYFQAGQKLGLAFTDQSGQMLPMVSILEKIRTKFGAVLDGAESKQLKDAFGSDEAVALIKLLINDTAGLQHNIRALGKTTNADKARAMASKMTDQWERLGAVSFALRAKLMGGVYSPIAAIIGRLADAGKQTVKWMDMFPHLTRVIATTTLGVVAITGAIGLLSVITALGRFMMLGFGVAVAIAKTPLLLLRGAIWAYNTALKVARGTMILFRAAMLAVNIAMYANPVGLIILGVVALVAAVSAAIYYWDDFKAALADWGIFKTLGGWIDALIGKLKGLGFDIDTPSIPTPTDPGSPAARRALPPLPGQAELSAYLAPSRDVRPGAVGQQLIQANARAQATSQGPYRGPKVQIGEQHINVQTALSPAELAQNAWLETRS
ncbi:phage tail tape measure protein [Aeromonas enteropelogenes]|uniref:phage tail tape measure protein n=1 Tax=Aeromonas enteropelogenes TaxID=29489 RepID=UPI003BA3CA02